MKQQTKKRMITGTVIIIWLLGCYFIGQALHPRENTISAAVESDMSSAENNIEETTEQEVTPDEEKAGATENVTVTFINAQQVGTEEIPWGLSAGIISLEDGSEAWLLTPGTILCCESPDRIRLEYRIHPWMKDISNGAMMEVSSETDQKTFDIGITPQEIVVGPGQVRLELLHTDNDNGDWVIIQQIKDD